MRGDRERREHLLETVDSTPMVTPQDALQLLAQQLCRRIIGAISQLRYDPWLLDSLVFLTEQLYQCLNNYEAADTVAEASILLISVQNEHDDSHGRQSVPVLRTAIRGRPRFLSAQEQLHGLLDVGFTVPRIAQLLGTSVHTIRRRMEEYGMRVSDFYSDITDSDLDRITCKIVAAFPNSAWFLMMAGHLRRRGFRVQQQRIRERIAPASIVVRMSGTIVRRVYSVAAPLALWHIDGNHKHVRYVTDVIIVLIMVDFLELHAWHIYSVDLKHAIIIN